MPEPSAAVPTEECRPVGIVFLLYVDVGGSWVRLCAAHLQQLCGGDPQGGATAILDGVSTLTVIVPLEEFRRAAMLAHS